MKVSNNKIGGQLTGTETGKAAKTEAAALKKDVQGGALNKAAIKDATQVNLSERAQMMQKAKDIAGSPMTVDEAKVARLQQMIDEGRYKVDADAIADRLIDEHLTIPD